MYVDNNQYQSIIAKIDEFGYTRVNLTLNFKKFNNRSDFSWAVVGKNNKVINNIKFNLTVLPNNVWTDISLTHYSISCIPQYVSNLNDLSNKVNE